jgi:cysteine-rich repeat protein
MVIKFHFVPAAMVMLAALCSYGCAPDDTVFHDDAAADSDDAIDVGGDGDGGDASDRDESRCGDGIVADGEECDDANDEDADGCSNACQRPSCGDGILQADETCDDGNQVPADGCSSTCVVSGTVNWSSIFHVFDALGDEIAGASGDVLAIDSEGGIAVIARDHADSFLIRMASGGSVRTITHINAGIYAVGFGLDDRVMVGGGAYGNLSTSILAKLNDEQNVMDWVKHGDPGSMILGFAVHADGMSSAVGFDAGLGFRARHNGHGDLIWSEDMFSVAQGIEVGTDGSITILTSGAQRAVHRFHPDDSYAWVTVLPTEFQDVVAMSVDDGGNVYVAGSKTWQDGYYVVARINADGSYAWKHVQDDPDIAESARAVAALPGDGGFLVAGSSAERGRRKSGLLSWYGPDGTLIENHLAGDETENQAFNDLEVSTDGTAVATGYVRGNGDQRIWVTKFSF